MYFKKGILEIERIQNLILHIRRHGKAVRCQTPIGKRGTFGCTAAFELALHKAAQKQLELRLELLCTVLVVKGIYCIK